MGWYSIRSYGWGGFAPALTMAELEAKADQVAARIAESLTDRGYPHGSGFHPEQKCQCSPISDALQIPV